MTAALSRLTRQGQISVPLAVRRKLGLGPGSVLEWRADGEKLVVTRAGRFSSEEVHAALFPRTPRRRSLAELKAGRVEHVRRRHARR